MTPFISMSVSRYYSGIRLVADRCRNCRLLILMVSLSSVLHAAELGYSPTISPAPATGVTASSDKSAAAPAETVLVVPATIEAFYRTDLFAKDSGYITNIACDIGDHVSKGQVLAIIDDPELQAQAIKAQANVDQTTAAAVVARRQLVALQADYTLQQVTVRRLKELFSGKAVTPQMFDEAQAKEAVAGANADSAQAKIQLADADVQAASAEANRVRALLPYDHIVAPYDAIITQRQVNPGDLVQAATTSRTTPLFTCQHVTQVRVMASVSEADVVNVHLGMSADVILSGSTGVVCHGSVTRMASALDTATRTMQVEIDLPNPEEKLMPGMYAQVSMHVSSSVAATSLVRGKP